MCDELYLENIPRDEVATVANISDRLENPQASTWQAMVNLLRNYAVARGGEKAKEDFRREMGHGMYALEKLMSKMEPVIHRKPST
jgi:hypothetical protein